MAFHVAWVRLGSALALAVLAAILAGCAIQGGGASLSPSGDGAVDPQDSAARPSVKVALLLPLTSTGHTEAVAKAMKQAAELAIFELDNPNVQLIAKDDKGTPEGAQAAAEEAIREGAGIILGPLFAGSVRAVAPVAGQAGIPVLAFSNDSQVAGNGVYLLGFPPQQEVERVIGYALSRGHRRFAALLPEDAYGKITESAFRQAVGAGGGAIAALETYPPASNAMVEPAERIVAALRQAEEAQQPITALFIPGGPEVLPRLGPLLSYANIDTAQVLGFSEHRAREGVRRWLVRLGGPAGLARFFRAVCEHLRQLAAAARQHGVRCRQHRRPALKRARGNAIFSSQSHPAAGIHRN